VAANVSDQELWVRAAEAVLLHGGSLEAALEVADRVITTHWQAREAPQRAPLLAKCNVTTRAPTAPRDVPYERLEALCAPGWT
jgi:hypothetical protein